MVHARTAISPYRPGKMVVIVTPGSWFGRTGELAESPDKEKAEWLVIVTCNGVAVACDEHDLMPDPRVW